MVFEGAVPQWVDGWLNFFLSLQMLKDIPKVNTWLQETTLLQKIATCNPSSKCHWWSCINVAGLFVFFFPLWEGNPHISEGKDDHEKDNFTASQNSWDS